MSIFSLTALAGNNGGAGNAGGFPNGAAAAAQYLINPQEQYLAATGQALLPGKFVCFVVPRNVPLNLV